MSDLTNPDTMSRIDSGESAFNLEKMKPLLRKNYEAFGTAAAILVLAVSYVAIFQVTRDQSLSGSIVSAARNIVPLTPLLIIVRYLIRYAVRKLPIFAQLIAHSGLASLFSVAWYILILFTMSLKGNLFEQGIALTPFYSSATSWQLYQGLILYAAIVANTYVYSLLDEIAALREKAPTMADAPKQSFFVKSNGEFVNVVPSEIISITAEGDVSILKTKWKSYKLRTRLKEIETQLDANTFVRIHRSHIVNLVSIQKAEPTGDGRLSVHLDNNETLVTSRAGAQSLKKHIA